MLIYVGIGPRLTCGQATSSSSSSPSSSSIVWHPPELGLLKLNFDESCVQDHGKNRFRGVIRDHGGVFWISFAGPLSLCSAIDVELHALWRGLMEMEELGASGGILEGDSNVILGWASGVSCSWKVLDKMKRIRHVISANGFLVFPERLIQ